MALNPIRLIDWMYLYQSSEDKRPQFYLKTDNDTFPDELRLERTTIPDLNMRIRTGNLDEVFEKTIDHITPVFAKEIPEDTTIKYMPDTAGFFTERYFGAIQEIIPYGIAIEIFLKTEAADDPDRYILNDKIYNICRNSFIHTGDYAMVVSTTEFAIFNHIYNQDLFYVIDPSLSKTPIEVKCIAKEYVKDDDIYDISQIESKYLSNYCGFFDIMIGEDAEGCMDGYSLVGWFNRKE